MGFFRRGTSGGTAVAVARAGRGDVEGRTQEIGRELLAESRAGAAGALSKKFWSNKLMGWALSDEQFKVQLFRFIDVYPALKTSAAVHEHLMEYLDQPGVKLPPGLAMGLKAGGLLKGALAGTIESQVTGMARQFIAGKDLADALPVIEDRWQAGVAFSVDLLGEACVSEEEAAHYRQLYMELIQKLAEEVKAWPTKDLLERDHLGPIQRANVSIKISALDASASIVDSAGTVRRLVQLLGPILQEAKQKNVLVNFDMEHHGLKDLTIDLFKQCVEIYDFPAGLALQTYLRSADADAAELVAWAKRIKKVVTVRLIKGAYWDYETIHAGMMGWKIPVWGKKYETDACFERVMAMLIREMPRRLEEGGIRLALGTHNTRSMAKAMALLEAANLPASALEFQALRGMADEMKGVLAGRGYRVREYMPIGEMIPGMAYLVRRLLENTSNEGWLRAGTAGEVPDEVLLASPEEAVAKAGVSSAEPARAEGFVNEPFRDFSDEAVREAFAKSVAGAAVPATTDGGAPDAERAIERAAAAFAGWRDRPVAERAAVLTRAAALLRRERDTLAGIMTKEAAKNWAEADGDVCEAVDFCEFYAAEARHLFAPERLRSLIGESNDEIAEPRGVTAVISPWNFPLAICMGMTVAALVTGNTVIVKPAEQTPGIAKRMCEILWEAGAPKDVLQFLPGVGEVVGAALVADARVGTIAFTGSREVGLAILRAANSRDPLKAIGSGVSPALPRVICELGGKNAVIVDSSADLDEAVLAVRQSAFGFGGQKCSAASRVIVMEDIHDLFVRRLVESARLLNVGDPTKPGTDIGPVIDAEAGTKIRRYIEIGKQEATLAFGHPATGEYNGKPLVGPHIFTGVVATHRLAQEEIFGPVLAVMKAKDFDEALAIANGTPYKLTGGLFSRTPTHIEKARREFRVGNLYLNRGITGALVGRQPFGGFGMSGGGTKAGGAHYLRHFVDLRAITENTMRRGFAPES
jgi:RHH-type proline utilization regulon transcriptional repressor/proline dehydrogenase/delta 1-pyrroline-5-carboxylate dehydrogenase